MSDWVMIHEEIVSLGRERARRAHALGVALLRAQRALIWEPLGMATFSEYAERYLGLTPRQTEERLRVAQALEALPLLDASLASGELHFSAVRELTRVATAETEAEWIRATAEMTVGDIERLVSGRDPGDRPGDPDRPRRHLLVLHLSADTYALYREAQAKLRRDTDAALSEEDGLQLMARRVLGGPADDGRSPNQIHMTICEACGRGEQEGRGRAVAATPQVIEQARCDAQVVDASQKETQDIPLATRRRVLARQHGRCGVPGCRNATFTDVHHATPRAEGGTQDPDALLVLCSAHHTLVYGGSLRIEGTWSTGFRFLHADGSPYGAVAAPAVAAVLADVYQGLRSLNFSERAAKAMVDAVRPHVGARTTFADTMRLARRRPAAAAPLGSSP